ncbi:hypothetical protein AQI95_32135 [Streptomyces yokosukanensis]|uniref:Uncharacterized protein n=1 Tax=Streptomyces yokosukanensis TaxID=67386 RepID=A0A101NXG1_9ACTN|nr:hypothetical protein AQI95_32135 [Streptomyces yokosukanensis]
MLDHLRGPPDAILADEKDRAKLDVPKQLWLTGDDFTTAEFQAMRAVVLRRMKERRRKTSNDRSSSWRASPGRRPKPTGGGWRRRRTVRA